MSSKNNKKFEYVLSIETSCDDTSVAVVDSSGRVLKMLCASQDTVHAPFGGVVPEIASRNHSKNLLPLIDQLLKDLNFSWDKIDGIAVTNRPGLIGSLLVGLITAKTLSLSFDIPFIGVNHLEGHIMAPFLSDQSYSPEKEFTDDFIALAISGGHTSLYHVEEFSKYKVLGQTIDDAAGEAFDKFAKTLGLGYPGGVLVDKAAKKGDVKAYSFPRPLIKEDSYRFSFSGLKAAGQRAVEEIKNVNSESYSEEIINNLCASYQQAIIDVLLTKLKRAVKEYNCKNVVITGGVSANSGLREQAIRWTNEAGLNLLMPPLRYCTDNAAMIGLVGIHRLNRGEFSLQTEAPKPNSKTDDFF